eukprot:IDg8516t1
MPTLLQTVSARPGIECFLLFFARICAGGGRTGTISSIISRICNCMWEFRAGGCDIGWGHD